MNQDVVSFVLRFVREMGEDQQARWRGIIKHVQGNTETHFSQYSEALEFMQSQVNETIRATFEGSKRMNEENLLLETTRLWGEFMPRYTRIMMDSMNEMMGSNPAMTQQMEKTIAAAMSMWGVPTSSPAKDKERPPAAATLDTLTEQVSALAAKLDALEARMSDLKNKPTPAKAPRKRKKDMVQKSAHDA